MGYQTAIRDDHSESTEDRITQTIVDAIKQILKGLEKPRWASRYVVNDQILQSIPDVEPKERPKIDIQMESTARNRPIYHFEAKRLRKEDTHSVSEYCGAPGLGGFLDGSYGYDSSEGGMIGYMQSETLEHWQQRIWSKLIDDRQTSRMTEQSAWSPISIKGGPLAVYTTRHRRQQLGEIDIYHTLLDFRAPSDN
jgi:hypothetical protein